MKFAALLFSAVVLSTEAIKITEEQMPVEDDSLLELTEALDADEEVQGVFRCGDHVRIAQGGRPSMCKVSEFGRPFGGRIDCKRICRNGNIAKHCSKAALRGMGC